MITATIVVAIDRPGSVPRVIATTVAPSALAATRLEIEANV